MISDFPIFWGTYIQINIVEVYVSNIPLLIYDGNLGELGIYNCYLFLLSVFIVCFTYYMSDTF